MAKRTDLTPIFSAANAALRAYNRSHRKGHILRAHPHLRNRNLPPKLVEHYLADIDREIAHIVAEGGGVA